MIPDYQSVTASGKNKYVVDNRFRSLLNENIDKYCPGLRGMTERITRWLSTRLDMSRSFLYMLLDKDADMNKIEGVSLYLNGMVIASVSVDKKSMYSYEGCCSVVMDDIHGVIKHVLDNNAEMLILPGMAGTSPLRSPLLISSVSRHDIVWEIVDVVVARMLSFSVFITDFDTGEVQSYYLSDAEKVTGMSCLVGTAEDIAVNVTNAMRDMDGSLPDALYVGDNLGMPMHKYDVTNLDGVFVFSGSNDDSMAIVTLRYK